MSTQTSTSIPKVKSVILPTTRSLPGKINISGVRVEVVRDTNLVNKITVRDGTSDAIGYTYIDEQKIALQEGLPPDIEADTVLHEIEHWIFYLNGGREVFSHKKEEQFISIITSGLLDTLKRNKELRDYLFGDED